MTFISRRRALISAIAVAGGLAAPAAVHADGLPESFASDAAQSGYESVLPSSDRSDAAQIDPDAAVSTPATIEVVRPERTIVREVDAELPLIMSGAALLLVLAGGTVVLVRSRSTPRLGRSH
jgi:hypothetical protein